MTSEQMQEFIEREIRRGGWEPVCLLSPDVYTKVMTGEILCPACGRQHTGDIPATPDSEPRG